MKYVSPLLVVEDMERSTLFYHEVLGLDVESNLGANVTLHGGIVLQTRSSWMKMTGLDFCELGRRFCEELYFEEPDFDAFAHRLNERRNLSLLHNVHEERWGQRTIRFYDPDGHLIEVGEPLENVAIRLVESGMTEQEAADRMDVMPSFVRSVMKKRKNK